MNCVLHGRLWRPLEDWSILSDSMLQRSNILNLFKSFSVVELFGCDVQFVQLSLCINYTFCSSCTNRLALECDYVHNQDFIAC